MQFYHVLRGTNEAIFEALITDGRYDRSGQHTKRMTFRVADQTCHQIPCRCSERAKEERRRARHEETHEVRRLRRWAAERRAS
jgi:hypothetical protein